MSWPRGLGLDADVDLPVEAYMMRLCAQAVEACQRVLGVESLSPDRCAEDRRALLDAVVEWRSWSRKTMDVSITIRWGNCEAANITAAQCKARGCSLAKLGVLGFSPVELIKKFDCNPKMLEETRFRCWFLPAPAPA